MLKTEITPEMHYDDWAAAYESDVQGWDYNAPDRIVENLKSFLRAHPGSPRLLDVGIGTGLLSEKCRALRPDLKADGIDISNRMLDICARKNIAQSLHRCDIATDRLPFADRSFDIAAAAGVMENVSNIDNALREMARVVRPGGLVLFTYMPAGREAATEQQTMNFRPGRTPEGKFVMGRLTLFRHNPAHLENEARGVGLKPAGRERFVGYRTYVVVTVNYELFSARKVAGLQ